MKIFVQLKYEQQSKLRPSIIFDEGEFQAGTYREGTHST